MQKIPVKGHLFDPATQPQAAPAPQDAPVALDLPAHAGLCAESAAASAHAVFMVTTNADSGVGSLRQAMLDANMHDTRAGASREARPPVPDAGASPATMCGETCMRLRRIAHQAVWLGGFLAAAPAVAQTYSYVSIAVPTAQQTLVTGVNATGTVVGNWVDSARRTHGYVWQSGQITTIDPPGSVNTLANGINDSGEIVGEYETSDSVTHGFTYSGGKITTADEAGASDTALVAVNNSGEAVADIVSSDGFVVATYKNGRFKTIVSEDDPQAVAINAGGAIAGVLNEGSGQSGFVYRHHKLETFSIPGAGVLQPGGINKNGVVVGYFFDSGASAVRGFVRDRDGKLKHIRMPGKKETFLTAINDAGTLVGYGTDSGVSKSAGFVLSGGTFTSILPPGGSLTLPMYINNSGVVTGQYNGPAGNEVFIATP